MWYILLDILWLISEMERLYMCTYHRPKFRKVIQNCTFYMRRKQLAVTTEIRCHNDISQMGAQLLKESRSNVPSMEHILYKGKVGFISVDGSL
jgi:hypothetical protein